MREDARAPPPEIGIIQGRSKIVKYIRQLRESGDVSFELGVIETVAEGNIGYLVGTYVFTSSGNSVNGVTHEAYRLQPDGAWKSTVDMWHNSESS
jgi:hypothetical protein